MSTIRQLQLIGDLLPIPLVESIRIGDLLPKRISSRDHLVQSSSIRPQKAKQDSYIFIKLLVLALLVVSPSQADLSSTQRSITRLIMVLIRILVSGPLASRSAVRLRIQPEPSVMSVLEHYSLLRVLQNLSPGILQLALFYMISLELVWRHYQRRLQKELSML